MPNSILDAIKQGIWDYEPHKVGREDYDSTRAMPGTDEKLKVLAERLLMGQPLWHPSDSSEYDDPANEKLERL